MARDGSLRSKLNTNDIVQLVVGGLALLAAGVGIGFAVQGRISQADVETLEGQLEAAQAPIPSQICQPAEESRPAPIDIVDDVRMVEDTQAEFDGTTLALCEADISGQLAFVKLRARTLETLGPINIFPERPVCYNGYSIKLLRLVDDVDEDGKDEDAALFEIVNTDCDE